MTFISYNKILTFKSIFLSHLNSRLSLSEILYIFILVHYCYYNVFIVVVWFVRWGRGEIYCQSKKKKQAINNNNNTLMIIEVFIIILNNNNNNNNNDNNNDDNNKTNLYCYRKHIETISVMKF